MNELSKENGKLHFKYFFPSPLYNDPSSWYKEVLPSPLGLALTGAHPQSRPLVYRTILGLLLEAHFLSDVFLGGVGWFSFAPSLASAIVLLGWKPRIAEALS